MPKSNEKDLRGVPDEVKKQVSFTFVSTMDEVLRLALLPSEREHAIAVDQHADLAVSDAASPVPVTSETGTLLSADRS